MWHTNLQGDVHGQSVIWYDSSLEMATNLHVITIQGWIWLLMICQLSAFWCTWEKICELHYTQNDNFAGKAKNTLEREFLSLEKEGVSFPGSSKVCPLFANFFWSTNVTSTIFPSSYLHIFTLSHIETKIQVSFPTSSPPLGAFSFHHHQQQPYDMSPPANQSWAPPTSLTSLKGYGHTSSNLRP